MLKRLLVVLTLLILLSSGLTLLLPEKQVPGEPNSSAQLPGTQAIASRNVGNDSWWDSQWPYRIPVKITERESIQYDDLSLNITLDTSKWIAQGKMREDGGDVRIIDDAGSSVSWVNITAFNTTNTKILFLMSCQADEQLAYFIYFGNPSVTHTPPAMTPEASLVLTEVGHIQTLWQSEWVDREGFQYDYRLAVTVSEKNGDPFFQYQVNVSFDHASPVSLGKAQADGSDLRVITQDDSGNWYEIPYEMRTAWNASDTEIMFPVDLDSSDSKWHYFAYGNATAEAVDYAFEDVHAELEPDAVTEGLWHFNEGEGEDVWDATVNENNGLFNGTGAATWTDGVYSDGMYFDGSNDNVDLGQASWAEGVSDLSVSAWFKTGASGPASIVAKAKGDVAATANFDLYMDSNENLVGLISTSTTSYSLSSSTTVNDNEWHLGTFTYDTNTFRLYLDGEQEDSISASGTLNDVAENLTIGKLSDSYPEMWEGAIDEVRISSMVRDADRVLHAYQMRKYHHNPPTWGFGPEDRRPTPPEEPTNLHASASSEQVLLTWNDPFYNGGSPVTNIKIYRGTVSGELSDYRTIGNSISFLDVNVTNGQTYYYKVAAVNSIGMGAYSNMVNATPATVPLAPQYLEAVAGDDYVKLTWTPPAGDGGSPVLEYHIYKGETNFSKQNEVTVGGNVTTYNDSFLQDAKTYYYHLRAHNAMGDSDISNWVEAQVLARQVPMPPSNLSAFAEPDLINLSWEIANTPSYAPVLNHTIMRWQPGGSSEYYTTIGNHNHYQDTNVVAGESYIYSVQAINKYGAGNPSIEAQVTAIGPPSPPSIYDIVIGDGEIEIKWNPPDYWGGLSGGGGYHIYRGDSPGTLSEIVTGYSETWYKEGALTNGQTYYYAVDARGDAGISPLSNIVNGTPNGLPGPPQNLAARSGDGFVYLTWDEPTDMGGDNTVTPTYTVYRGESSESLSEFQNGLFDREINDTSVENGQEYFYAVSMIRRAMKLSPSHGEGVRRRTLSGTRSTSHSRTSSSN